MTEVVSPSAFGEARASLLKEEKEITQRLQTLAAKRRALPRVEINDPFRFKFTASDGTALALPDLFENRKQLMLYHFMLPASPNNASGCPGCSFFGDSIPNGPALNHLHSKSVTFCCVAPGSIESINAFKERMEWAFPFSSTPNLFKVADEKGEVVTWKPGNMFFGLQVFLKEDDGTVYHTYETTSRGVEVVLGTYALLDMTPLGRQEEGKDKSDHAFRLHDEYDFAK